MAGWFGAPVLVLETVGRRSGKLRATPVLYVRRGDDLVVLAANAGSDSAPAWWLNLQAHPEVSVDLPSGSLEVRGRAAKGEERSRLWSRWCEVDARLGEYAPLRSGETAVVVLEPLQTTNG